MRRLPVGWILKWGERWVHIDSQSGGYPCGVVLVRSATIFHDTDTAADYAKRLGVDAVACPVYVEVPE